MVPKSWQGWCMPTIQYVQRFVRGFRHNVKVSMMQPRNWERLRIFAIQMCRILVLYASSVYCIFQ